MKMERTKLSAELASKMLAVKGKLGNLPLDGYNPHFKSRFTKLATLQKKLNPLLEAEKLLLSQDSYIKGGLLTIRTVLQDTVSGDEGVWFIQASSKTSAGAEKTAQNIGADSAYLSRIALVRMWSVPQEEDDDGNSSAELSPVSEKKENPAPIVLPGFSSGVKKEDHKKEAVEVKATDAKQASTTVEAAPQKAPLVGAGLFSAKKS